MSARSARRAGIPFVLGETNSFFGHGSPGVSNAAAQALWMIDYSLQAASIGVTGLYYHQGVGYNYSGRFFCKSRAVDWLINDSLGTYRPYRGKCV
jgi:hypothetical protein